MNRAGADTVRTSAVYNKTSAIHYFLIKKQRFRTNGTYPPRISALSPEILPWISILG